MRQMQAFRIAAHVRAWYNRSAMPDSNFKQRDGSSYDAYAETYNQYIEPLAAPLARRLCSLAQLRAGDRVLDVGCGTGVATRWAARAVAPSGSVLGIDLSAGMIDMAVRAGAPPGASPLEFRVMDAEALDLPAESFDAVVSLCAVLHFPDVASGLSEMFRVLKPGGRLVVSFGFGRPLSAGPLALHVGKRIVREARQLFRPELRAPSYLMDLAGRHLPEDSQPVLTEWGMRRPAQRLAREVRLACFENLAADWAGHEVRFDSAEEFWAAQIAIVTEVRKRWEIASPASRAALKKQFLAAAQSVLARHGELVYPYGAYFLRATRPN